MRGAAVCGLSGDAWGGGVWAVWGVWVHDEREGVGGCLLYYLEKNH